MYQRIITLLFIVICVAACSTNPDGVMPTNAEPEAENIAGDVARGEVLFKTGTNEAPACSTCHQTEAGSGRFVLGPNLSGVAERAGERVEDLEATEYLHRSIVHPAEYVVAGFRNFMYAQYGERLSPQEVADLVAYLMTL